MWQIQAEATVAAIFMYDLQAMQGREWEPRGLARAGRAGYTLRNDGDRGGRAERAGHVFSDRPSAPSVHARHTRWSVWRVAWIDCFIMQT